MMELACWMHVQLRRRIGSWSGYGDEAQLALAGHESVPAMAMGDVTSRAEEEP